MIGGGGGCWPLCIEFRLDIGAEGGGDLTRGERVPVVGVVDVVSADVTVLALGSFETASVTEG